MQLRQWKEKSHGHRVQLNLHVIGLDIWYLHTFMIFVLTIMICRATRWATLYTNEQSVNYAIVSIWANRQRTATIKSSWPQLPNGEEWLCDF